MVYVRFCNVASGAEMWGKESVKSLNLYKGIREIPIFDRTAYRDRNTRQAFAGCGCRMLGAREMSIYYAWNSPHHRRRPEPFSARVLSLDPRGKAHVPIACLRKLYRKVSYISHNSLVLRILLFFFFLFTQSLLWNPRTNVFYISCIVQYVVMD